MTGLDWMKDPLRLKPMELRAVLVGLALYKAQTHARTMSVEEIDELARSITRFGLRFGGSPNEE